MTYSYLYCPDHPGIYCLEGKRPDGTPCPGLEVCGERAWQHEQAKRRASLEQQETPK